MASNRYPELKIVKLAPLKTAGDTLTFAIPDKHIICGVILPEIDSSEEAIFNLRNLEPYELAVSRYNFSDLLFDVAKIQNSGTRTFEGMTRVIDASPVDVSKPWCAVIVCYLKFT